MNIGMAHYHQSSHGEFIEALEGTPKISQTIGDTYNEGIALGNLANSFSSTGDSEGAMHSFEQALQLARETGDLRNQGNV